MIKYADAAAIRREVAEIVKAPPPEQRAVKCLARAIAALPDDRDAALIFIRSAQRHLSE